MNIDDFVVVPLTIGNTSLFLAASISASLLYFALPDVRQSKKNRGQGINSESITATTDPGL